MNTANYLELYEKMVLIRTLETNLLQLAESTGEISDLHLSRGQEAISVGVCSALRPDDYMVTHHRTIAHSIAKGMPLQPLIDEILGRATGVCGGKANEMHIRSLEIGYMFSFQLVGTAVPVAAGIAWASRYVKKEDKIVVLFVGDASTGNGQFLEGMNAAAIRKVPLLVVIEDNHLAGNITPNYYFPDNAGIEDRFSAFGIDSVRIDGNKIDEVIRHANEAADTIRTSSRPFGLICDTTRLLMHKIGQGDVRTPEQIAQLARRDPIVYLERKLGISESQKMEAENVAQSSVNKAIDSAHKAPWPKPDRILSLE
ncbi:MAG TPA: thiamine pyrophosphate-dependent dehydrogenase E1 component subunit alpha [Nitrososphaerales archaeon]|nr:thiamine pyrophosphate-dependent dehydrogenase E1 component subunit alpha [Nitrososphaerales archaeon]